MAPHLAVQLLVAVGGVVLYAVANKWKCRYTNLRYVPKAPGGHWLWGHEWMIFVSPDSRCLREWFDQFKTGILGIKGSLMHPDILAIRDPAALTYIFTKNSTNWPKSPYVAPLIERSIGRGLVWSEGELHKLQRQASTPFFNNDSIRRMDPVMRETGDKFVVILNDHIERSRSVMDFNGAVQINAIDWMNKAIMDITGKVAFGYDFKFGMAPEAELILKVLSEMNRTRQSPGGFVAPLVLRAFPFITSLPMESIQAEGEVKTTTKELGRRLLRERKLLDENGDARGHDYLSALRNMYNVHTEDSIELDGILDQIATLIVAAQENSPSTLAHILYALSHDKDAQNRLRQELLSFSSTSLEGEPTYAEYQTQLPFLDAVLKEILRLHPTTGWSERVALEDDVLPLNVPIRDGSGKEVKFVDVKAGQVAVVPHLAINRSNEVFPDPDEFRPERWLTSPPSPDKMMPKGWNGLATFIEGPHICIGLRLALHEIRVLLSTLVKNFEFLPVEGPDGKVEDLLGATLRTFIVGRREDGPCIPVMIRPIHA